MIGSGPASLTVAADVRREGHAVTIFEAFHKPGGVMIYGIPEFRLPKKIVQMEIDTLEEMGVELETNFVIGRTRKLQDLMDKDGFDAVFIGTGAGLPKFMNIEGENLVGVFSANEYLTRANLMRPTRSARRTRRSRGRERWSCSAAATWRWTRRARRCGWAPRKSTWSTAAPRRKCPRGSRKFTTPRRKASSSTCSRTRSASSATTTGCVTGIECLRYELGEPDESGRRRPVEVKGSEFVMRCDTVIVAIGNESNPLIKQTTPELKTNKWGNIIVDESGKTSIDRVYAGGDIVLGAATVILAMGQGRVAAKSINEYPGEQAVNGRGGLRTADRDTAVRQGVVSDRRFGDVRSALRNVSNPWRNRLFLRSPEVHHAGCGRFREAGSREADG